MKSTFLRNLMGFIGLALCLPSFAQQTDTTYHSKYGMKCDADTAHFYRISLSEGERSQITEYFTSNQQIRRKGVEVKIGKITIRDGLWETFYENGNPKIEVSYVEGDKAGTSKEWFESGQQEAVWNHDKGNTTLVSNWSKDGEVMATAGEGAYEKHYPNGQLHYGGPVKAGKQTGNWKAYHNNGQLLHDAVIEEGMITGTQKIWNREGQQLYEVQLAASGTSKIVKYWNEVGAPMHADTITAQIVKANWVGLGSVEPYPINMAVVRRLIGYPLKAVDMGIQGQVVVRALVNEKGEITKENWITKVHPLLSDAVQANLHELHFAPAIQGGEYIKFWVNIPFRFKLMGGTPKRKKRKKKVRK